MFDGANRLEKHNANQHHGLSILQWEREALSICANCPVWRECREWALHEYSCDEDVVGGLTGNQRRQIRRGRIPAPKHTERAWCLHGRLAEGEDCPGCRENRRKREAWTQRQRAATG